jgi:hypothetical protein
MAIVATVSIGTSNKVSVNYQSQEVNIAITYQLEREDTDLLAFVQEKAAELEKAHSTVWQRLRELRQDPKTVERRRPPVGPPPEAENPPPEAENPPPEAENPPPEAATDGDDPTPPATLSLTGPQQRAILALAQRARMTDETFAARLETRFGKRAVEQLTQPEAAQLLVEMQRGTPEIPPAEDRR